MLDTVYIFISCYLILNEMIIIIIINHRFHINNKIFIHLQSFFLYVFLYIAYCISLSLLYLYLVYNEQAFRRESNRSITVNNYNDKELNEIKQ